jgi:hypothetical protein
MTFYIAFGLRAFVLRFWAYDPCEHLFVKFEVSTGITGKLGTWRRLRWLRSYPNKF